MLNTNFIHITDMTPDIKGYITGIYSNEFHVWKKDAVMNFIL